MHISDIINTNASQWRPDILHANSRQSLAVYREITKVRRRAAPCSRPGCVSCSPPPSGSDTTAACGRRAASSAARTPPCRRSRGGRSPSRGPRPRRRAACPARGRPWARRRPRAGRRGASTSRRRAGPCGRPGPGASPETQQHVGCHDEARSGGSFLLNPILHLEINFNPLL